MNGPLDAMLRGFRAGWRARDGTATAARVGFGLGVAAGLTACLLVAQT
jgi:hypothetical protein